MATLSLHPRSRPSLAAAPVAREGRRVGRYEIVSEIGAGGAARVWVARGDGKLVAIKTLRPEYATVPGTQRMLLDEAAIASRIAHPNVLAILEVGLEGDVPFYVMPLVEGGALSDLMSRARRPIAPRVVSRLAIDLARGLHAAHEAGVVHRDVSPHNVLVGADGVALLADFGVAKANGRTCDETQTGQLKGKLAYMAPEQLGRDGVNARTDIFAAGIVMWEMLTARRLFRGADVLQTIELVRTLEVPDPRTAAPSVPAALAAVVLRALERDPERRFATAAEMADAIEQACAPATRDEIGGLVMRVFPSRHETPTPTPSFATIVDLAEDVAPATITSVPLTPLRPRRVWPLLVAAALLLVAIVPTSGVLETDAHTAEIRARTKAPPVVPLPPPPPVQVAPPPPTATPIPTMTLAPTPPATHKRAPRREVPHLKHPNPYGT